MERRQQRSNKHVEDYWKVTYVYGQVEVIYGIGIGMQGFNTVDVGVENVVL